MLDHLWDRRAKFSSIEEKDDGVKFFLYARFLPLDGADADQPPTTHEQDPTLQKCEDGRNMESYRATNLATRHAVSYSPRCCAAGLLELALDVGLHNY